MLGKPMDKIFTGANEGEVVMNAFGLSVQRYFK